MNVGLADWECHRTARRRRFTGGVAAASPATVYAPPPLRTAGGAPVGAGAIWGCTGGTAIESQIGGNRWEGSELRLPRPDFEPRARRDMEWREVQRLGHERVRLLGGFGGFAAVRIAEKAPERRTYDFVVAQGAARGRSRAAPTVVCSSSTCSPMWASSPSPSRTYPSSPALSPTRTRTCTPSSRTRTSAWGATTASRTSSSTFCTIPSTPAALTRRTMSGSALGSTRGSPVWRGAGVAEPWGVQQWWSSDRYGGKFLEHWYEYRSEVLPQPYTVHISFLLARYGGRGDGAVRRRDYKAATPPWLLNPHDLVYFLPFGHWVIGGAAALRVLVRHLEIPGGGGEFPVLIGCDYYFVYRFAVLSVYGVLSLFPTDALRVEDLPFLSPMPFLPHTPHIAGGMSRECM